jgi:3-hydroxyacyl-CoA dehydrogenase / enoyl-CoA hydratase / 3-hydroxybutyryl-CoA epimerase
MDSAFELNVDKNGTAFLVFDLPGEKVNKLSLPILKQLEEHLDQLALNKDIKALVFSSGKEEIFIAGADLHSFEKIFENPSLAKETIDAGHRVFGKLENLPFPTIALIQGTCLGGGLELALACTYRVATDHPKTQLGLPEVTLGIIPGWGGTQRAPRLIGFIEGLSLIVSGKPLKAQKAWKVHLVDALVAWEFKSEKTADFVQYCLTSEGKKQISQRRQVKGIKHLLLEANPLGRAFVCYKVKKQTLSKTKGHYPAPLLALNVIKESYPLPLEEGLKIESKAILENLSRASDISRHLISLFFISESLKKDTGVPEGIKPRPISSTGVLGAGVMGSGIAWLLSTYDFPVRLKDVDYTVLGKGFGVISELYHKSVKDKRLKKNEADLKFLHVSGTTDYSGFQSIDLVIEAAVENLDLKNKLYAELEAHVSDETTIASNTSSLSISEMSKAFKHPERFIGMHFFNPVPRMPLVEIVPGANTSSQTIATAVEFCKKIGKTPLVVGDCPGFLVNRIFAVGANELMFLLEEGINPERIENMMLQFGYPMGPFTLADEVGIDVMYKVNKTLELAYGQRMKGPKIIETLYEHKLFGKKSGKGFYIYQGKNKVWNKEVSEFVKTQPSNFQKKSDIEMNDQVMLTMINEAARCLEEKIISRPDYLDMAMIMGTGFPPFRGGLLKYADTLGIGYVADHLKVFEKKQGDRFTPCARLLEMQKTNKKFYES